MSELESFHRELLHNIRKDVDFHYLKTDELDTNIFSPWEESIVAIRNCLEEYIRNISDSVEYKNEFSSVLINYKQEIDNVGLLVYENIFSEITDLLDQANELFFNKRVRMYVSGIVISGFGEDDFTPKTCSIEVDRVVENKLAYVDYEINDCMNGPAFLPYAQSSTVNSFISGIDEDFQDYIGEFVDLNCPLHSENLKNAILGYSNKKCKLPIYRALNVLPKNELAMMAETLINLTAFKLKITNQLESVGGPIDVAIITKSEGFIWFKRKYYFDSELNPHYNAKYYKD